MVEVRGVGEYTDNDEDGIIYIDGLRAGEYSVSLLEAEGYKVPNTITSIQIKQEIEYRVLDDIEYLIMTEDDIDAEKEDKEVKGADISAARAPRREGGWLEGRTEAPGYAPR